MGLTIKKEILESQKLEQRAKASELAIEKGNVKSIQIFKKEFEAWKKRKRQNT